MIIVLNLRCTWDLGCLPKNVFFFPPCTVTLLKEKKPLNELWFPESLFYETWSILTCTWDATTNCMYPNLSSELPSLITGSKYPHRLSMLAALRDTWLGLTWYSGYGSGSKLNAGQRTSNLPSWHNHRHCHSAIIVTVVVQTVLCVWLSRVTEEMTQGSSGATRYWNKVLALAVYQKREEVQNQDVFLLYIASSPRVWLHSVPKNRLYSVPINIRIRTYQSMNNRNLPWLGRSTITTPLHCMSSNVYRG